MPKERKSYQIIRDIPMLPEPAGPGWVDGMGRVCWQFILSTSQLRLKKLTGNVEKPFRM
jgi:hypothetical protein